MAEEMAKTAEQALLEAEEKNKQEQQRMHERLASWYKLDEVTWSSAEEIKPGSGIWVYHDVFPKEMDIIKRLEEVIESPENSYEYSDAMVGYSMKIPEYRDCVDFKYKETDIDDPSIWGEKLRQLARETKYRQLQVVKDYTRKYHMGELRYWEATNYVRYGVGQHFQEHHDHGYSYNCVLSLVGYPNDDYDGGELTFRLQNITAKPRAGDLFVFPSNFMYPHRAMPVTSGVKWSMVTMLDYSEKFHGPDIHQELEN